MSKLDVPWHIGYCDEGEQCWCRSINTKKWNKRGFNNDDLGECIVGIGCIHDDVAEHIVKVHNEYIKGKTNV